MKRCIQKISGKFVSICFNSNTAIMPLALVKEEIGYNDEKALVVVEKKTICIIPYSEISIIRIIEKEANTKVIT